MLVSLLIVELLVHSLGYCLASWSAMCSRALRIAMDTEHLSCAERRVSGLAVGDGRFFRAMVAPASNISLVQAHACGWCVECASMHAMQKHIHRLDVQLCVQ